MTNIKEMHFSGTSLFSLGMLSRKGKFKGRTIARVLGIPIESTIGNKDYAKAQRHLLSMTKARKANIKFVSSQLNYMPTIKDANKLNTHVNACIDKIYDLQDTHKKEMPKKKKVTKFLNKFTELGLKERCQKDTTVLLNNIIRKAETTETLTTLFDIIINQKSDDHINAKQAQQLLSTLAKRIKEKAPNTYSHPEKCDSWLQCIKNIIDTISSPNNYEILNNAEQFIDIATDLVNKLPRTKMSSTVYRAHQDQLESIMKKLRNARINSHKQRKD